MPLINAEEFRERFDIDGSIDKERFEPHIGSASKRLRGWVGDAVYDAAAAAQKPGEDADTQVINDLKNAEAHLTMHYALFGLTFRVSSTGIAQTETSSENHQVRRYLSPKEAKELSAEYLNLAEEIATPYMLSDGTPGPDFVVAVTSDDCALTSFPCEAVTRVCR